MLTHHVAIRRGIVPSRRMPVDSLVARQKSPSKGKNEKRWEKIEVPSDQYAPQKSLLDEKWNIQVGRIFAI